MKKCCSKTLLNEWKTFLKENAEFTKEVYKVGQKVRVEICCDGCGEAVTPTLNDMEKGRVFSGIVIKNIGPQGVKFSGEQSHTEVNMIIVKCDEGEFIFPQCCLNLGEKNKNE